MIDTFIIQVNGKYAFTIKGELRPNDHPLGPGGVFTVHRVEKIETMLLPLDELSIIALPDAHKTTSRNPARLEQEKKENR